MPPSEPPVLWHLSHYGRERRPIHAPYWWECRTRIGDTGPMVFQRTITGRMVLHDAAGTVHQVPAGHAALFVLGEPCAYGLPDDASETYVHEWVNLGGAGLREHWHLLIARFGPVVAVDDQIIAGLQRLRERADPRLATDPVLASAAVQEFVHLLFRRLGAVRVALLPPVDRAIDELLSNPIAAPPLKRLAERHGCSREHLARRFHERIGEPPAHWLARRRCERALTLLRSTSLEVTAIARQCGFGSVHTLARHLRAATGLGPRALRRG